MRNKLFWWIFGVVGISGLIIASIFVWMVLQDITTAGKTADQEQETAITDKAQTETGKQAEQGDQKNQKDGQETADKVKNNPFDEPITQEELTESKISEYIHGMSHQKVKAEAKWGFYLITKKRINWLLDGLDKTDLGTEKKIYREILTKWAKGDFSNIVHDHNAVWKLQGGTIGKATGILSKEDEKAYIRSQK